MSALASALTHIRSWPTLVLALSVVASSGALVPAGVLAAEPSAPASTPSEPAGSASPQASPSASEAACQSAEELRLIVGFLRDTDVDEDGWLPIFVGAIAGLAEARTLLGLTDDAYRPLVEDLVTSLQSLFSIADEVSELETLGAKVAELGETITAVGIAMDELSVALRDPCPTSEPASG
jgi:hypothetical protein